MPANKTVIRFNHWIHADMLARYDREPGIDLVMLEQDDEDGAWPAIAAANAYQISAAKDEVMRKWQATAEFLERAPNMLCISSGGAGYDTVDVEACTKAGVLVVNQSGGNAQSVAEHTLGMMLDLSKRISETDRLLRTSRGYAREELMGREISGRTIGIVGLGHVGRRVAALAQAFDMSAIACDPYVDADKMAESKVRKVEFDTLLAEADFVSIHCPRNTETLGMMDADAFAKMKQGATLLTTARGGIVNEQALLGAIESGHLGAAGIDVWDIEPPPLDHPLLQFNNVVSTYHTAGVTHEARGRMARIASEQVIDVLAGKRPPRLINPDVWPAYAKRFERIMDFAPEN